MYPKIKTTILRVPNSKDHRTLGSILLCPYDWKLDIGSYTGFIKCSVFRDEGFRIRI